MGGLLAGGSLGQWGRLIRANDSLAAVTIDQQGSGKLLSVQKAGVEQFAVNNDSSVTNPGEYWLITPAAIGALAADTVKLGITDIAVGDARLAVQAEVGNPIYIGNNAIRISGVNVLGAQGAAVADADGTLASVNAQLNTLLARVRTHGMIAT